MNCMAYSTLPQETTEPLRNLRSMTETLTLKIHLLILKTIHTSKLNKTFFSARPVPLTTRTITEFCIQLTSSNGY